MSAGTVNATLPNVSVTPVSNSQPVPSRGRPPLGRGGDRHERPASTDLIAQALDQSIEQVDVNGTAAWLSVGDGRRSIVWSRDGTNIVVLGVADDRIDPLTIAQSLTEFDIADYETRTTTEVPAGVGDGCDGSLFC